jgi:hypothetical protein
MQDDRTRQRDTEMLRWPQPPEEIAKELTIAFLQTSRARMYVARERDQVDPQKTGEAIGDLYRAILAKLRPTPSG